LESGPVTTEPTSSKRWIVFGCLAAAVVAGGIGYNLWRIEVEFNTTPPGAVVRIDGRGIGLTPLTVSLEPGRHLVEFTHSHFLTHGETIDVARGDRVVLDVKLASGMGRLALLSNPRGAWVEIDGRRLESNTPTEVETETGPTTIRMGLLERHVAEKEVIVLPDQVLEVTLELNMDPHGSLTVSVTPADARITLPELDVPYTHGVRLPIGEQLIEVSRPGFETQQIRHDIRYGENITRLTMSRALGEISVTTTPTDARVSLTYESAPDRYKTVDYQTGMRLPVGRIEVRARAIGHRTAFKSIDLSTGGRRLNLTLQAVNVEPGEVIQDSLKNGGKGPLMVVIPGGEFVMGDPNGTPSVQPARVRTMSAPFAMSVREVSVAEFRKFAVATGFELDDRLESPEEPVRYLGWKEAVAYADWLTRETGARYRLPTEAEWEYAARAGSDAEYSFGDDVAEICRYANLADQSTRKIYRQWDVVDCDDGHGRLAPVGSYDANAFGLHDMHGNVAEWILECGMPPYSSASDDGSETNTGQSCRTHGFRGGSWDSQAEGLRSVRRGFGDGPSDDRGIRLVREL